MSEKEVKEDPDHIEYRQTWFRLWDFPIEDEAYKKATKDNPTQFHARRK